MDHFNRATAESIGFMLGGAANGLEPDSLHGAVYTQAPADAGEPLDGLQLYRWMLDGWTNRTRRLVKKADGDGPVEFKDVHDKWGVALDSITLRYRADDEREPIDVRAPEDGAFWDDGADGFRGNPRLLEAMMSDDPPPVRVFGVFWGIEASKVAQVPGGGLETQTQRFYMFTTASGTGHEVPFRADDEAGTDDEYGFASLINARNLNRGTFYGWDRPNWTMIPPDPRLLDVKETPRPKEKPAKRGLSDTPEAISYSTFVEMRGWTHAIRDARTGANWYPVEGEAALIHRTKEGFHQTRFDGGGLMAWWSFTPEEEALRGILEKFGPDAPLLMHVCLGMVAESSDVTIDLDALIKALGWDPRSTADRAEMRRRVWLWLTCFECMPIYGARPGKYKDNLTKEEYDLMSRDPFIRIMGTRGPAQQELYGGSTPVEVSFAAGKWIDRFKGNGQVLSRLGDVRAITAIPAKRPSGAWARSYAQALLQQWREDATDAKVIRSGDAHTLRVSMPSITREALHDLCPREPFINDLLESDDPKRAVQYDAQAWEILKRQGVIANKPAELAFKAPGGKYKWARDFMTEPLNVKPGPEIAAQLAEIREAHVKAQARVKKSPKQALKGGAAS